MTQGVLALLVLLRDEQPKQLPPKDSFRNDAVRFFKFLLLTGSCPLYKHVVGDCIVFECLT